MAKLEYFKTDRNGTKYYYDWTCPRCGGAGGADQWAYTGYTCYECGGSGLRHKPQIVKEYTPEYQEILDKRRAEKHEREMAEREAKAKAELPNTQAKFLAKEGFNSDGYTYLFLGDTYSVKDQIKSLGGKFDYTLGWHIDHEVDGFQFLKIHIDEVAEPDLYEGYAYKQNISNELESRKRNEYNNANSITPSEWVGEVGQKIEIEAVLTNIGSYESTFGWTRVYTFTDDNDNDFIWKTTSWDNFDYSAGKNILEIGDRAAISGTIKDHNEYRGVKQTVLTRCKVNKV